MMMCNKCGTHYADDTLVYCLQDGVILERVFDTAPGGEVETVVTSRPYTEGGAAPVTTNYQPPPTPPRSNTLLVILGTVLVMVIVFGVIGAGIWFYMSGHKNVEVNVNGNSNANATPTPRNRNTNSTNANANVNRGANANTNTTLPPININEIKRDVEKTIMTWRSITESGDLDSLMGNYADTVDYYRNKAVNKTFIRTDKQRAFDKFDSINLEIDNIDITVEPTGDDVTVQFDKEWEFEGTTRSEGKVRQELKMKRSNGAWLITSERDIQEYRK